MRKVCSSGLGSARRETVAVSTHVSQKWRGKGSLQSAFGSWVLRSLLRYLEDSAYKESAVGGKREVGAVTTMGNILHRELCPLHPANCALGTVVRDATGLLFLS